MGRARGAGSFFRAVGVPVARPRKLTKRRLHGLTDAEKAAVFLETLRIPEGPLAGQQLRLAPFQKQFVDGALAPQNDTAVLSVGRGNAKSALSSGLALGALLGIWDGQPRRDIIIAARTRDQARVAWQFAEGFSQSLPEEMQKRLTFRRSPRLEIAYEDDGGEHVLRAIAADGKSALGTAPNMVLMDERGHWSIDKGDALEHALMTGLGKRGGRALLISTSAPDDAHPFSRWIDEPPAGCHVQEHRPAPGLPADDEPSLLIANPGAQHGVGASLEWLKASADRAIARGGSSLSAFRLLNRNERVSGENRDVLLTLDQWLACESEPLPAASGPLIIGLDLGGSASMTAVAFYWPETGRFEAHGWFPSIPGLADRGAADGVGGRYEIMKDSGELSTLGERTVPVRAWVADVMTRAQGFQVAALVCDRYKQAEFSEALQAEGVSVPVVWRGMGFRDGGEDVERFRRAAFDRKIVSEESLLVRSAMADAVCLRDPAGNAKLAKARSLGRIDAASAAVLAIGEGMRMISRPSRRAPRTAWA